MAALDDMGADALILSDYGLMRRAVQLVRRAEVHASTLAGVYNAEDVKMLRDMGVKRVILSSDLFVDEIVDIIDRVPELDYEIVADGGICFNSNRQCLLPHVGQKECYQVYCQKEYELVKDGEKMGRAKRIGNPPGKIHHTMGIYLGHGCVLLQGGGTHQRFQLHSKAGAGHGGEQEVLSGSPAGDPGHDALHPAEQ